MGPLTYVLGAIAGFFTFGGIGLIIKGYQLEGGISSLLIIEIFHFKFFIVGIPQ